MEEYLWVLFNVMKMNLNWYRLSYELCIVKK